MATVCELRRFVPARTDKTDGRVSHARGGTLHPIPFTGPDNVPAKLPAQGRAGLGGGGAGTHLRR